MSEGNFKTGTRGRSIKAGFRYSEEDFQRLLDAVPVGVFRATTQHLQAVNSPLAEMLDWGSPEEMLADDLFCSDLLARCGLDPDAIMGDEESVRCDNEPVELRRRDGPAFHARLTLQPVCDAGGAYRFHEGFVENLQQVEDLERRLREAQELAMRGQVAGGLAHDFNNILSATLIHIGLLLQDPDLSAANKEGLKAMQGETERAAELTRQLLSFSRRNPVAELAPLELNRLLNTKLKMVRRVARENVLVVFLPAAEECRILADAGLIEMLIMHLCFLSRGTLPRGGTITLATSVIPKEGAVDAAVCLTAKWSEGEARERSPSQRLSHLREVREAETYRAICEIVKLHHGRVEMPIEHSRDSTIRLYFPVLAPTLDEPLAEEEPAVRGGNETILLVEDERYLRRMTAICLRKLGYAVLEAGDEQEAAAIWEKHKRKINLMLTDYLLPGPSTGLDLARRLEREKPTLKVVIASGQGADFEHAMDTAGGAFQHLAKPFEAGELAVRLRACLDQPSGVVSAA